MEVWAAGEGIRSNKEMAWDVDDFEIKIGKIEQPSCLSTIEVLCLMEVCQVLVVHKDLDGKRGSVEVVSPGFQGMDYGKEFPVVNVIVSFCRDEQLGEVGTGVPVAVGVSLEENSARGIL